MDMNEKERIIEKIRNYLVKKEELGLEDQYIVTKLLEEEIWNDLNSFEDEASEEDDLDLEEETEEEPEKGTETPKKPVIKRPKIAKKPPISEKDIDEGKF